MHDPARMPFFVAWTDRPPAERARSVLQYQWSQWGRLTPEDWSLELVVLAGQYRMIAGVLFAFDTPLPEGERAPF